MAQAPPRPGPAPIAGTAMCPTRGSRQAARGAAAAPASCPRSLGGGAEVAPRPGEVSEALQPALPHPPPARAAGSGCPAAVPTDGKHGKVSPLHAPGPPCCAPRAAGAARAALGGDGRGGIVAGEIGAILGRSVAWRPRAGPRVVRAPASRPRPPLAPAGSALEGGPGRARSARTRPRGALQGPRALTARAAVSARLSSASSPPAVALPCGPRPNRSPRLEPSAGGHRRGTRGGPAAAAAVRLPSGLGCCHGLVPPRLGGVSCWRAGTTDIALP